MAKALVFDLDGTLVDTAPDLAGALNAVLAAAGRATLDLGELRPLMTQGALALIRRGFELTGAALGETEMAAARAAFLDYYGANLATQSRPFPGVRETLATLATSAGPLGVCTNKPESLSRCLFDALDLTRFFGAVLGGDSLAVRKPDPEHLWATIDALGAGCGETVMIGDSATDVATARNAGVPVIVVSYGYRDAPAAALGADAVIDSFAALPAALARLG